MKDLGNCVFDSPLRGGEETGNREGKGEKGETKAFASANMHQKRGNVVQRILYGLQARQGRREGKGGGGKEGFGNRLRL